MDFPEVSEDERPVKLEAPAEPDDSDAGLDDTALFQYHRRSRGPSTQDYSIVYAAGPTKQVQPFPGLYRENLLGKCPAISIEFTRMTRRLGRSTSII